MSSFKLSSSFFQGQFLTIGQPTFTEKNGHMQLTCSTFDTKLLPKYFNQANLYAPMILYRIMTWLASLIVFAKKRILTSSSTIKICLKKKIGKIIYYISVFLLSSRTYRAFEWNFETLQTKVCFDEHQNTDVQHIEGAANRLHVNIFSVTTNVTAVPRQNICYVLCTTIHLKQ